MSLYLSSANFTLCLFAHARHLLCACSRRWQFTAAEGETVSMFVLLTKADPLVFPDSSISSSSLENSKNKIRESGDPWGMPVLMLTSWLVCPPADRRVVCPLINPLVT